MQSATSRPMERVADVFVLREMFLDAEAEQFEANRRAARQCEHLADVLEFVRVHPALYVNADFVPRRADREMAPLGGDAALAERCAVLEASSRLRLTEGEVRSSAAIAAQARDELPRVWQAARDGLISIPHVKAVVAQLPAFAECPAEVAAFDELLREVAVSATVAATRRQARVVADRLTARTRTQRHADAFARRTVYVEDVADGMSWVYGLVATERAHAIDRELTLTAKHLPVVERDGRTTEQIRADLFADLLAGGEATTVKAKVLVTVPLDRLSPVARSSVRGAGARPGVVGLDLNSECMIPGVGPIDDATARQLLLDAGAFTRVITDPVTGVILDMDRRARIATRAQREWLALVHGTCARDGCERLALDADIDHHCPYHGPGRGETDIGNLDPLCDPDHALKDTTMLRHHRRNDGTVEVEFPSGHRTRHPFAGLTERVRAILDNLPDPADTPPF
ncbi:DUF222 domain-containing protein [Microbacterium jejuense]|uniref:DUF222 domain-containing protein n=1 Tax=Microbacterium jejuense TaxID=1263637 RepID=A0ABS7HLQ4_9MICO|nr:HNH endonuclease signature motif containing protein [Microbacterium jejuense]MBW9093872.1 DUF222 domain-containing protein [Microbacterium jejuense]